MPTAWRTEIRSVLASKGTANEFKGGGVINDHENHLQCPLIALARVVLSPDYTSEASREF